MSGSSPALHSDGLGRLTRLEDFRLLTAGGMYVEDVDDPLLEGAAHVCFVRSTAAHANIEVSVEEARRLPGVLAAFVASDLDLGAFPSIVPSCPETMWAPLLAAHRVRYVGEPVAVVVAATKEQAADATMAVEVAYDFLPAVVNVEEAQLDEVLLFADQGTNTVTSIHAGDESGLFDGCEIVVEGRVRWPSLAPCPLEGRSAASVWDSTGRLHHWLSSQAPQASRALLSRLLGVDDSAIRVVAPDVGGGFGAKHSSYPEDVVLAWIARALRRPVRWTETRTEGMLGMTHGRSQVQRVRLGGTRSGKLLAYQLDLLQDAGAYPGMAAYTPEATCRMAVGPYDVQRFSFTAQVVVTNTTPIGAYRGAGRPESTSAIEYAVDLFAEQAGLDPVEVRRRNLVRADHFPYRNAVGTIYDSGDYERALDMVVDASGYDGLRDRQSQRRLKSAGAQIGIGTSCYVESTGGPALMSEFASVTLKEDGSVLVDTGTMPHGQGHATVWTNIVSDTLGISPGHIFVRSGDTDIVPVGSGTFGSRSAQLAGSAVLQCSERLVERGREKAAELMEAALDDMLLDRDSGRFHVVGNPSKYLTWGDIAASSGRDTDEQYVFAQSGPTFAFGAHVAVVETDLETGKVLLTDLVSVDDAGTILNAPIVEGQRHGGIAQGVAQVMLEEYVYDTEGNPITTNLADYPMISAAELPSFRLLTLETPTTQNPLGVKGIGEAATAGAIAAVHSAVIDSIRHLGVQSVDMPATPERVWRAIQNAQ